MRKILVYFLISLFAFLFVSASNVSAKVVASEKGNVVVAKTEIVNDDLFIGAQSAQIDGVVNGDVFIGASSVKVNGIINGNLHVGASMFELSGVVKGNVYAGAQNVTVTAANISGSLIIGGATVNVDKDTVIGGSIITGAGSLSVNSKVTRSVYAGAGTLTLGETAKIGKDFYYATDKEVSISKDAKIVGGTYKAEQNNKAKMEAENFKKGLPNIMKGFNLAGTIISILGALIVGFVFIKFFGKTADEVSQLISTSFWKTIGIGFVISIVFIPALILLMITVIGIPLAGMALLTFILFSSLSKIVAGLAFGNWAAGQIKRKMSIYMTFAFGLLLIYLFKLVPIVGMITGLTVFWSGLGALFIKTFSKTE